MKLVVVRHGQTDLNKSNKIQGGTGDAPLNQAGHDYATQVAANFDPTEYDHIFSSPLTRAKQTAEIFAKGKKKVELDDRLREMNFGSWEGMIATELHEKYPNAFDPWGFIGKDYVKYAENAESDEDLKVRVGSFLDELYQKYPDGKILVVCHGVVARMIIAYYLSDGNIAYYKQLDNSKMMELIIKDGVPRLIGYNNVF